MSRWSRWVLVTAAWLALVGGLVALAARSIAWSWQPMIIAASLFPYLVGVGVAGGICLALRRSLPGTAAAVLLFLAGGIVLVPESSPVDPPHAR